MDGIVGIYHYGRGASPNLVHLGVDATSAVQHRGNASAGMAVGNGHGLYHHSGLGSIGDILAQNITMTLQGLHPRAFIGNVGYTKNTIPSPENAEPIMIKQKSRSGLEMMVTMDGYLWKKDDIKEELAPDYNLSTRNNTELIGALLHKYFSESGISFESGRRLIDRLEGRATFALCALVYDGKETRMITLNDGRAFEPFIFGEADGHFVASSESCAIRRIGGFPRREFSGAEMAICSSEGYEIRRLKELPLLKDAFQATYFGGPDSLFGGKGIFGIRRDLGKANVDYYGSSQAAVVIPNPDSGWGVSLGIFDGIRAILEDEALDYSGYVEGGEYIKVINRGAFERLRKMSTVWPALIKKAQAVRTFQQGEPSVRAAAVSRKFGAIDELLRGEVVACGDDSIVKGSVSEGGSLWMLFNSGIEKLEFRISYGPMIFPSFKEWHRGKACVDELAAQRAFQDLGRPYGRSVNEINKAVSSMIAKKLKVDASRVSVFYNPPGVVAKTIGPDCSYQALDASYPINEKFWPDFMKQEAEKFIKANR